MRLTDEQINELIDYLQGTCKSLDQGIYELFDIDHSDVTNDMAMYNQIDNAIFNCGRCGWWCEVGDWIIQEEFCGEEICSQCGEDE